MGGLKSEQSLRELFDSVPALHWIVAGDGRVVDANDRWLRFIGASSVERLGRDWLDRVHPDDVSRCQAELRSLAENCRHIELEFRLRRYDGEYRHLLTFSDSLPRNGGCALTSIDITEHRALEPTLPDTVHAALESLKSLTTAKAFESLVEKTLSALSPDLSPCSAGVWLHEDVDEITLLQLEMRDGRLQPRLDPQKPPPFDLAHVQTENMKAPMVIDSSVTDARLGPLRDYLAARRAQTLLLVPLLVGNEAIGTVLIGSTRTSFTPQELVRVQDAACRVALAVKVAAWVEKARQAAILEERHRIAGEIHDSLAQGFTGIVVQLEAAEDALENQPEKTREHLERARGLARECLVEARRSVNALRFQTLEEHDLAETLQMLLDQFTIDTGLRTTLKVRGSSDSIPVEYEGNLVRICQEALTNVLRYARASHVKVHLKFDGRRVELRIRDDGQGFDPQEKRTRSGFGLVGMRLRARRMNGRFIVRSSTGRGTTITVTVPSDGGRGDQ